MRNLHWSLKKTKTLKQQEIAHFSFTFPPALKAAEPLSIKHISSELDYIRQLLVKIHSKTISLSSSSAT